MQSIQRVTESAQFAHEQARQRALQVSSVLQHTSETLEQSARLADAHAVRQARAGNDEGAEEERRAAARARTASGRALAYAKEWRRQGLEGEAADPADDGAER